MCPKSFKPHKSCKQLRSFKQKQQGFLLPLAIFIIVVMGMFALVLSRNTIQSSTSAAQEVISTQAFYAAESGAQRGMQVLFFPTAPANNTRQQVDARCAALATTFTFTVTGLNNCSAVVSCRCAFQDESNCAPITAANYLAAPSNTKLTSFYTVLSTATCGSGNLGAVRAIEVGSFLKQE
jgi:MSHA biogenesis protein MshP